MKNLLRLTSLVVAILFSTLTVEAQKVRGASSKSPAAQVSETVGSAKITIDYSQPNKRGRDIFGELVPYGRVWRTGANEATWIELSSDVKVEGKSLKAGKYSLYTIPGEDEWTIIFNSTWDQWGTRYDKANDVLRINAKSSSTSATEAFTITVGSDGKVTLAWDTTKVEFAISG